MMKSYSSTVVALATVVLVAMATITTATATATSDTSSNTASSSSLRGLAQIVGGNESDEGEFPYYVGMDICGGALIAPSVVLFAAHCGDFKGKQVNVGSFKAASSSFGAQPAFCDEWIDDPTFGTGGRMNNDFALCLLDRDVTIDQTKVKLILNTNPLVPASNGDELIVMGLGKLSDGGDLPGFVHDVTVPTISNDNCNSPNSYDGDITNAMLCAGFSDGGKDSCQGDSGGPIVRPITLSDGTIEHSHVGVVSWGYGCAEANYPGVYARTSSGSAWIIDQVCNIWKKDADFCVDNTNTATTDVFENCDQQLMIELVTDIYASETSSILQEQNGDTVLERNYFVMSHTNEHKVCLKSNTCYFYVVSDSYGDGLCSSNGCGSFKLELNGELKVTGNPAFVSESPTYEICTGDGAGGGPPPVTDPTPSPATDPTPSIEPTLTPPTGVLSFAPILGPIPPTDTRTSTETLIGNATAIAIARATLTATATSTATVPSSTELFSTASSTARSTVVAPLGNTPTATATATATTTVTGLLSSLGSAMAVATATATATAYAPPGVLACATATATATATANANTSGTDSFKDYQISCEFGYATVTATSTVIINTNASPTSVSSSASPSGGPSYMPSASLTAPPTPAETFAETFAETSAATSAESPAESPAETSFVNPYVLVSNPLVKVATDCEDGQKKFQVKIGIDSNGGETYWELMKKEERDVIIAGANRVYEADTTYVDPSDDAYFCLDAGEYVFKIQDGFGDGLCCQSGKGFYAGYVNERRVFDGGQFGSQETETFYVKDSYNVLSDGPIQLPKYPTPADTFDDIGPTNKRTTGDVAKTDKPSTSPSDSPTTPSPSVSPTDVPTASPTDAPSDAPSVSPTDAPTSFPTFLQTEFPTQGCVDSTEIVFKKNKKCNFVKGKTLKKIRKKCKKKWKGVKVVDACPLRCGKKAGLGRCEYLYQPSKKNNKNKNKN